METPDVLVSDLGTIVIFNPCTTAAREWIAENVAGETTWSNGALVVEHRYADALAEGMADDGLAVSL